MIFETTGGAYTVHDAASDDEGPGVPVETTPSTSTFSGTTTSDEEEGSTASTTGRGGAVSHDVAAGPGAGSAGGGPSMDDDTTTTGGGYFVHDNVPAGKGCGPAAVAFETTTTTAEEQPASEGAGGQQPVAEANHAVQDAPDADAPVQVVPLGSGATAKGDPHLVNVKGERFDVNRAGSYTFLRVPASESKQALISLQAKVEPDRSDPCSMLITEAEVSGAWLAGSGSMLVRAMRRRPRRRDGSVEPEATTEVHARIADNEEVEPFSIQSGPHSPRVPLWEFTGVQGGGRENVSVQAVLTSRKPDGQRDAHSTAGLFKIDANGVVIKIIQKRPGWGFLNIEVSRLDSLRTSDVGGLLGYGRPPSQRLPAECLVRRGRRRRRRGRRAPEAEQAGSGLDRDFRLRAGSPPGASPGARRLLLEGSRWERAESEALASYASGRLE